MIWQLTVCVFEYVPCVSVCVNVSVSKESHLLMGLPAVNAFFGNLRATTIVSKLVDFVYAPY